jgi:2-keto-4-pentenoate hydratase
VASVSEETAAIAARFLDARRQADGFDDYPGHMPQSLQEAYSIQDRAIAEWHRPVIGWKVGRVPEPFASNFGTDRLAGPIFSQTRAIDGEWPAMPVFARGFAAGEAEFLLRIGKVPPAGKASFSLAEAADLIDAVHVGIEVASSPLRTINQLGPVAVVSDFGNNNGLLIGPAIPDWQTSGFERWTVTTRIDGAVVGTGQAAGFPDGAIGSARFLFELMAERGIVLQPGQWISSGAVTGVHDARPGQTVEATFDERFHVTCELVAQNGERPGA